MSCIPKLRKWALYSYRTEISQMFQEIDFSDAMVIYLICRNLDKTVCKKFLKQLSDALIESDETENVETESC